MPESDKIQKINPVHPEPDIIQKAGKILKKNGVVIFPAKCLYGVAAHALNKAAVQKVFHIKQRPLDNPLLVLVKHLDMLKSLVADFPVAAEKLINAFWPGNLTLVFKADSTIPSALTAGTGKIGIRIPSHPVAGALVNHIDFPITGTSANLSGNPGCTDIQNLDPFVLEHANLILNAGTLKGGKGSTIADVSDNVPKVLREGEITVQQIHTALE